MAQTDISNLISLTGNGLSIAQFTEIRSAIIDRYKTIYGSDIDLSTGTADGIFINDLALIINNILQTVYGMYSNLDVETATGTYLDTLCALTNVIRKPATKSIAYLNVKYLGDSELKLNPQDLIFVDKSGLEWQADTYYILVPNQIVVVKVLCSKEGPIEAPKNWIYQLIDGSILAEITQPDPAQVGDEVESDRSLRARRSSSAAYRGITTLDSLLGSLLDVSGISNVKIFNNNTSTDESLSDGSTLTAHSIYVAIRLKENTDVDDQTIGKIIYEKLTPGIHTCECEDPDAIAKQYKYVQIVNSIPQTDAGTLAYNNQYVYWKQTQPISPSITLTISPYDYFTTDEFDDIASFVMSYINSLAIDVQLDNNSVLIQTVYADPTFKGVATYAVNSVSITSHTNNIMYYYYTKYFIKCTGTITDEDSHTHAITDGVFTLSGVTFTLYNNCVIDESDNVYPLENNRFVYNNAEYIISDVVYTKTGSTYEINLAG